MIHLIKILCPTDYSSTSDNAVRYAVDFSRKVGAHVRFLHIPTPGAAPEKYEFSSADELGSTARTEEHGDLAPHNFSELLTAEQKSGLNADFRVINGDAATVIAEQALSWGADLIIMGFHGRTGRERLMMGSVSEEVFRCSDVPVLLVKKQAADKIFVE